MYFVRILAALALGGAHQTRASIVRTALDLDERSAARSYGVAGEIKLLPASCAAELLAQLPTLKHAAVMQAAGEWFSRNQYPKAIPALIRSFDRSFLSHDGSEDPPGAAAVARFGSDATPYLLQACQHGSAIQRAVCAQILSDFCGEPAKDARVVRYMAELSTTRDPRLRQIAIRGLWKAAVVFHIRMSDGIYFVEVFRPELLRYIIDAASMSDRGTVQLSKGYLYRLVWQQNAQLKPKDITSNPPPPYLPPGSFDAALASKQPEIRAAAIVLESSDGLDGVRLKAFSDPDPLVFHAAVASSKVMIGKGWLPHLLKLASSTDGQLRRAAATLLASSFDADAKPALRKLAIDPDPEVRNAARGSW